jgi:hypothetical protein
MAQNPIGPPTALLQIGTHARHRRRALQALIPQLTAQGEAWGLGGFWIPQQFTGQAHGPLVGTDPNQLMAPLLQVGGKLAELTREVLMDQQQSHLVAL